MSDAALRSPIVKPILLLVAVLALVWAPFADASVVDRGSREPVFQTTGGADGSQAAAELEQAQGASSPFDLAPWILATRLVAGEGRGHARLSARAIRDRSPPLR